MNKQLKCWNLGHRKNKYLRLQFRLIIAADNSTYLLYVLCDSVYIKVTVALFIFVYFRHIQQSY